MRFHLDLIPEKPHYTIGHSHSSLFIGSCFSENIGDRFKQLKFKALQNPSGILFNPFSIHDCIGGILDKRPFDKRFILQRDDNCYSFLHHSSIHAATEEELIRTIETRSTSATAFLSTCNYLFITLGTAYYYHHKQLNATVANCHKQPGSAFDKKLAGVDEIVARYNGLLKQLSTFNPSLKVIFTVSPVKHLRMGIVENSLSKAILLLAVHRLCEQSARCHYFPAYELVNDDLRDHRFYKEDLAHPNEQAIAYVWEKFSQTFFSDQTRQLDKLIEDLNKALAHRPIGFNRSDAALQDYIEKQKIEIKRLNPELGLLF